MGSSVEASVVIASHNRPERLGRLLEQLARQDMPPGTNFEVCIVDDGSCPPVGPRLENASFPHPLRIFKQENQGAAGARDRGAREACGRILIFVDDDMQLSAQFVRRHLAEHEREPAVVLGRIAGDPALDQKPLFERWQQHLLDRIAGDFVSGRKKPAGPYLFTGNVSVPRAAYLAAGGFDSSLEQLEDTELGVRLERLGLTFRFAPEAVSLHCSDHTSLDKWRRRARRDGRSGFRISRIHSEVLEVSPFRFLFELNPLARPPMAFALFSPRAGGVLASAVLGGATLADRLGLTAFAYAGITVAYMMEYFRGVRGELPSLRSALREVWAYRTAVRLGSPARRGNDLSAHRDAVDDERVEAEIAGRRLRPPRCPTRPREVNVSRARC